MAAMSAILSSCLHPRLLRLPSGSLGTGALATCLAQTVKALNLHEGCRGFAVISQASAVKA